MEIRKVMRTHNSEANSAVSGKNLIKRLFTIHHSLFTNNRGFTLIEAVIVMVIVAILAAVVILRNPFDSIKLNSATRKVAADIRYVQKLSISNQTRAGMTFNANGYTVYSNISTLTQARSSGDPCATDATGNFIVLFTAPRCSSYANVQLNPLPTTNPIAFNSLGTPVNQWGTILGNQSVTVNYSGSNTINIEAGTGRVSY